MAELHSVVLLFLYLYFFCCNAFKNGVKQEKYKVILKEVYNCSEPHPPYARSPNVVQCCRLNVVNGKRFLNGNTTIINPTPFKNFSARTYVVNNGNRENKLQIENVSCKNMFARTILVFSNISFTQKNCMLKPGQYPSVNMDMDKISHALPSWHAPGDVVHQLQLVANGATEFCSEIVVEVKHVK